MTSSNWETKFVSVLVSDLFLRLWSHPNGECRMNAVKQLELGETVELVEGFATSLAASVGYVLDDACNRLTDIVSLYGNGRLAYDDMMFLQMQSDSCSSRKHRSNTSISLCYIYTFH